VKKAVENAVFQMCFIFFFFGLFLGGISVSAQEQISLAELVKGSELILIGQLKKPCETTPLIISGEEKGHYLQCSVGVSRVLKNTSSRPMPIRSMPLIKVSDYAPVKRAPVKRKSPEGQGRKDLFENFVNKLYSSKDPIDLENMAGEYIFFLKVDRLQTEKDRYIFSAKNSVESAKNEARVLDLISKN
jgi:hypothetical protein